jgi:hypothetical protein
MAQEVDAVNLDSYVEQLSASCPCGVGDGWAVNAVAISGDTVVVNLETPSSLAGFLPMLVINTDKAKRLWIDHLSEHGEEWKVLVTLLRKQGHSLKLLFAPSGSTDPACLFISSENFGTLFAEDNVNGD